jgi:hypothetical protein
MTDPQTLTQSAHHLGLNSYGRVPLIILLLTSYLTAAMEMPICGLEVVLHPDDTDLDLLELVKAYCDILGYRATDQKPLSEGYLTPHSH